MTASAGALLAWVAPALVAAASPTATPSAPASPGTGQLPRGLEPTDVSPGVAGFLATAFVVVLSILLILNLVSRMRRIRHRAAMEEARDLAAAQGGGADDGTQVEGRGGARPPRSLSTGHDVVSGEVREAQRDDPDTRPPAAT